MTEAEWLACEDAQQMLKLFGVKHHRKLWLLISASSREIWPLLTNLGRWAVTVSELYADGTVTELDLRKCMSELEEESDPFIAVPTTKDFANSALGASIPLTVASVSSALSCAVSAAGCWAGESASDGVYDQTVDAERDRATRTQVTLLRDIFGNPFRPVAFSSSWRSETVVALASAIYTERAFDRMPILADALEEAGCDHADVLSHCRGPGPHVRGCWVVDGVLGKE
jgi:hypothetical protein